MTIEIREVGPQDLTRYQQVPIRFRVESVLQVEEREGGLGGLLLDERPLLEPYTKDYDVEGERPIDWPEKFDVSAWGFFLACCEQDPVGGAAVAHGCPDVTTLRERTDMAALWDIRVHPDRRGEGIGRRLFRAAASWAGARGCRLLKVETQNVNVRACRFYQRMGCRLGAIDRYSYALARYAHETKLLWYLDLAPEACRLAQQSAESIGT